MKSVSMGSKKKRSALHKPPAATVIAETATRPSMLSCFMVESQSSRRSAHQTHLLGNNCFCLKTNCSGVVHVVEMDRVLTSPCFDFPIYSLETRRLVKCNKCFYVSSLQAHRLNSTGKVGLGNLPVVKLNRAPPRDGEVRDGEGTITGDSTLAVRPEHGYVERNLRPPATETSSYTSLPHRELGTNKSPIALSIEKSSVTACSDKQLSHTNKSHLILSLDKSSGTATSEKLPSHKKQVSISEPYIGNHGFIEETSGLNDAHGNEHEVEGAGSIPNVPHMANDLIAEYEETFTEPSQENIDAFRQNELAQRYPNDNLWQTEEGTSQNSQLENNFIDSEEQPRRQRTQSSKSSKTGLRTNNSKPPDEKSSNDSYLNEEQTQLIGSLISKIEKGGSTEDEALHLGRMIQKLKAQGGLEKFVQRIQAQEAGKEEEQRQDQLQSKRDQVGEKRAEPPQWLIVKAKDEGDGTVVSALHQHSFDKMHVDPPMAVPVRNAAALQRMDKRKHDDPPISSPKQSVETRRAGRGRDPPNFPYSECSQSSLAKPDASQTVSFSPAIPAAPSDLVHYIARRKDTDIKTRDPPQQDALDDPQTRDMEAQNSGTESSWRDPWKSKGRLRSRSPQQRIELPSHLMQRPVGNRHIPSFLQQHSGPEQNILSVFLLQEQRNTMSDPPMNDPPMRNAGGSRQEPGGAKAKHREPRGRRKSCPSRSSRLTNPTRKKKSNKGGGLGGKDEPREADAEAPEFFRSPQGVRQDAPVHDFKIPELPKTPPYDGTNQSSDPRESTQSHRIHTSYSRIQSPGIGRVNDDPYNELYPTTPLVEPVATRPASLSDAPLTQDRIISTLGTREDSQKQYRQRSRGRERSVPSNVPLNILEMKHVPPPIVSLPAVQGELSLANADIPHLDQTDKTVDDIIKETVTVMRSSIPRSATAIAPVAPVMPELPKKPKIRVRRAEKRVKEAPLVTIKQETMPRTYFQDITIPRFDE